MRRFRVSGFCLRSFARAKNGVNSGRRSHKISVGEAKSNICRHKRAGALHLIRSSGTFPSRGRQSRVVPRGQLTNGFYPNTETFSALHNISVVWLSRLARSSGVLRGRSRLEFIMSPPGKRRHNELNAAPPPETPRRTGKPGETNNRNVVHSGESFRIRAKNVCSRAARHDPTSPSP